MKSYLTFVVFLFSITTTLWSQEYTISGTVSDSNEQPLSFATILVFEDDTEDPLRGVVTEDDGKFMVSNLKPASYTITISYIGFISKKQTIDLFENRNLGAIILVENNETLDETVVTAKRPTITKTSGKLVFNVENTSLSTGSTFDLLKRTPGILVIGNEIKIKFSSPVIYINNRRVYLSSSEIVSLLQNTDASTIKSVEVITNPSAQFDAEAGSVLNIITSKPISVGYKGSVSTRYEQATFAKYNVSTAHFYKNDWLNFYGSYGVSPRKEIKKDENKTRFFTEDEVSTKSFWESDFTRTTRSRAHQATVVADMKFNNKNNLSFTSNVLYSPDKTFNNTVAAQIYGAQRQLDSTLLTKSRLDNTTSNLSFSLAHELTLGDKGASLTTTANYIKYNNDQGQQVATDYFLPNEALIRNNSFITDAFQDTNILTGQVDVASPLWKGTLNTGLKYSNITTESGLDFFTIENGNNLFNAGLSDLFVYDESIYAGYINYEQTWDTFSINLGLRGEYTDVVGDSKSLGIVNTQEYFELFPSASVDYTINDDNSVGISYSRKIGRPRYQSLNPFRYFINENNFTTGNPNLVPAITNRIQLSIAHKGKWFFDLYYEGIDNELAGLTFQDNTNSTLRTRESNLEIGYQYSFDMMYASYVNNWWYLTVVTSNYYMKNRFLALESSQETFSPDTYGFFSQMFSRFTLSKKQSLTSDLTFMYISDFLTGSSKFQNQLNTSISFRKSLWNKRASLTVGVDDIFDTNNVEVTSKYYNQDNSYFARPESRLFRVGFTYNFGNARLRDNGRTIEADEKDRL